MKNLKALTLALSLLVATAASAEMASTPDERTRVLYAKQVVQSLKVTEFKAAYVEGAEGKTLVLDTHSGPKGAPRSPLVERQAREMGFASVAYQYHPMGRLTVNVMR